MSTMFGYPLNISNDMMTFYPTLLFLLIDDVITNSSHLSLLHFPRIFLPKILIPSFLFLGKVFVRKKERAFSQSHSLNTAHCTKYKERSKVFLLDIHLITHF